MNLSKRKILSLIILALIIVSGKAQINNSLYFMHGVPQANRINPAIQPNAQFYLGFPGLAPLRASVGSSSLAYGDIIYPHPTQDSLITFLHPLGNKQAFLDLLKPVNFVVSDLGTSLLSAGFKTPVGFFSLDVTTRVDGNVYYPGDLFRLMINGADEGETYLLDGIGADISAFNEVSLGWSINILENLQIGARAKTMFGLANLSTTQSNLSVSTSQEVWNIQSDMAFKAALPFVDVALDQDGMLDSVSITDEFENLDPSDIAAMAKYVFNWSNFGLGLDVGINFRPIDQLLISASVMDIGYIRWTDGVQEVNYNMAYDFTGLEVNPLGFSDDFTFGDYLDSSLTDVTDSLANALTFISGGAYAKRLNTKLFVGASYFITPRINLGLLSRTDFLNEKISQQVTASANLTTGRFINLTLSYSYMNAYYKNIGAGFSFNVGPLNMYLISDNVLNNVFWPQESRSVNLWFGMNLVFGYKKFMKAEFKDKPLVY